MTTFISVDRARERARRALPGFVFDIVDGGSDDEVTMRRNRVAFESWTLRQLVGTDVGQPDTTTTLAGLSLAAPIIFAPCGLAGIVHPDGELAVARVASKRGTVAMFSTFSTHSLEDIARAALGPKWFQLYFLGGRSAADALVDRAAAAGFGGLVVTLDTSVVGNRERDLVHGISYPIERNIRNASRLLPSLLRRPGWLLRFVRAGLPTSLGNAQVAGGVDAASLTQGLFESPPTWSDVARLRERWPGTLVVKGVLDPDDARRAAGLGADVIVVSNHGGRQLDSGVATLDALPAIVSAVGGSVQLVLDGGVRRGTDVVKALALGATAVGIGRPYLFGLGVAGQDGVDAIWTVFMDELCRTMQLMGCASIGDLSSDTVRPFDRTAGAVRE